MESWGGAAACCAGFSHPMPPPVPFPIPLVLDECCFTCPSKLRVAILVLVCAHGNVSASCCALVPHLHYAFKIQNIVVFPLSLLLLTVA